MVACMCNMAEQDRKIRRPGHADVDPRFVHCLPLASITYNSCPAVAIGIAGGTTALNNNLVRIVFMGGDNWLTVAAGVLSFLNNISATSLIAYKAW